jgi:hypothetical protein
MSNELFIAQEIAGVQGKEVELYVKQSAAVAGTGANVKGYKIRGAQSFSPNAEQAESKVSELGVEAQKTIYGTTNFSVSTSLIFRDLVQLARLSGVDPSTAKRFYISDFAPVNCLNWIKNPDDNTVISTVYVSGYKPRTSSTALAVEANAQVTLDGAADAMLMVPGKATVREFMGNSSCCIFGTYCYLVAGFGLDKLSVGLTEHDIFFVEYPAGTVLTNYDGYTFVQAAAAGAAPYLSPCVCFTTAPETGRKVRICYRTSNSDLSTDDTAGKQ